MSIPLELKIYGVQYYFSEAIGLRVDPGLAYGRYYFENHYPFSASQGEGWSLSAGWRMGLIFRI